MIPANIQRTQQQEEPAPRRRRRCRANAPAIAAAVDENASAGGATAPDAPVATTALMMGECRVLEPDDGEVVVDFRNHERGSDHCRFAG